MESHERRASVLVAQDDVEEAVNKTTDAQLEAETALERAEKAERTAKEIRQLTRKLLERMRKLERQVIGHEQMGAQLRSMTSTNRARQNVDRLTTPSIRHRNQLLERRRAIRFHPLEVERRVKSQ